MSRCQQQQSNNPTGSNNNNINAPAGAGNNNSNNNNNNILITSTSSSPIGNGNGPNGGGVMEFEVPWNPIQVCDDLRNACRILSDRCLKLSAKWAAEQWMGLPQQQQQQQTIMHNNHDDDDDDDDDIVVGRAATAKNKNNNSMASSSSPDDNNGKDTTTTTSDHHAGRGGGIRNNNSTSSTIPNDLYFTDCTPDIYYAKTLFELGEYSHAAAILSITKKTTTTVVGCGGGGGGGSIECDMPSPKSNLSSFAYYLRAYALYMAGERRKEEQTYEMKGDSKASAVAARNPYLQQLLKELMEAYEEDGKTTTPDDDDDDDDPIGNQDHKNDDVDDNRRHPRPRGSSSRGSSSNHRLLDAFGLHVFGMVLYAARKSVIPSNAPKAHMILIESIIQFPYNWSAWLDLACCAMDDHHNIVEYDIEQYIQPIYGGHYMYHFFCAHLQSEHQAHSEALQIYERWMDPNILFGNSSYLKTKTAVVLYQLRQVNAAKAIFEELHNEMPYRLDSMDIYSNIQYVQEDSVGLSRLAHTAVVVDKYRAETCCIVGNYYSLKQQRSKAIEYFQRAIRIDPTFTSAWTLMGHEYVEWKQTANAMESYRRAVQTSPNDYRAWYGLGQTYEFLNMNMYALYYYKQAAQLRPYDARMWCAVGTTYQSLKRNADAIRSFERALQQDDTEGVATQKLATLYRYERQEEKAARCYFEHLRIRHQVTHPNNNSNYATTAAASTTNEPLSLEQLLQGLFVEGPEAEALLYLAHYHKDFGDYDMAALFASRLLDYPGNEKEEAKAILRELKSRKAVVSTTASGSTRSSSNSRMIHTRSKGPVTTTTTTTGAPPGGGESHHQAGGGFQFSP